LPEADTNSASGDNKLTPCKIMQGRGHRIQWLAS
jgi:hypothetical protein